MGRVVWGNVPQLTSVPAGHIIINALKETRGDRMEGRHILDSWKEIAAYIKRSEKTCRHWELVLGLPVHRLDGSPRAHVFAYPEEIDRWMKETLVSKRMAKKLRPKKILHPALVFLAIVILGIIIWRFLPRREIFAPAAKKSIAVLPFEDLSQTKNNEYLCDGISETIINALINIGDLWVPARTSTFFFKGKTRDIREIGQKLGVENVLEGSVQVAGDNLRVTARISNIQDGRQIWSEIYNRKMADMFAIQDDIAKGIVAALKVKLLGKQGTPFIKNYTENLEAYSLYLQGRSYWNKRDEKNLTKSIEYFEKAVGTDPNYSLAYTGLADAYYVLGQNGVWPAEKAMPKAKAAALKALEIDENLGEAHASLAAILQDYGWDFVGAEKEYRLAIDLNPGYATARHWYSGLLQALGRHEEAIREAKIAQNLDPLLPRAGLAVGLCFYYARRYNQAIEELNRVLEVDPNHAAAYTYIGFAYEAVGKYEEAVKSYIRGHELWVGPWDGDWDIAGCYALMGKREEARKILDNAIVYATKNYVPSSHIATVFSTLGEKDLTFAWLEKAFRERDPLLIEMLKDHYRFDPVRFDPRFIDLLRRIGLEK